MGRLPHWPTNPGYHTIIQQHKTRKIIFDPALMVFVQMIGIGFTPHNIVQNPVLQILQNAPDAVDVVIGTDDP